MGNEEKYWNAFLLSGSAMDYISYKMSLRDMEKSVEEVKNADKNKSSRPQRTEYR